ncbi:MAG: histidine phosphatase family protein [Bifidobacterium sp.]|jgi:probable phosphoglycerate mutase|nr:histidine phosphatase family protein [Bifidobacterium sp.]MCI1864866.1 histidine phosphatase family protein [Bifidobacterium sp.]
MSEYHSLGNDAPHRGFLVLLRHGQTAWSVSGQHTGRTDLPLTETGKDQARAAGARLRQAFPSGFEPRHVFASPLLRARQTAALAGFPRHEVADDIAEWDYGRAEGRTRVQIGEAIGHDWNLWRDGTEMLGPDMDGDRVEVLPGGTRVNVHNTRGEMIGDVAVRARRMIGEIQPIVESGHDVLLVAHAHILRILTTQWLDVDPHQARLLRLDTAHYSILSQYKGDNVIERWNV